MRALFTASSSIQTLRSAQKALLLLSVPELHRFGPAARSSQTVTAGREFHPALKIFLFSSKKCHPSDGESIFCCINFNTNQEKLQ